MKTRYVFAGASIRALCMFARPMAQRFSDYTEVVGIFDPNQMRAMAVKQAAGLDCPLYTDFDKMLAEQQPDRSIIATIDSTHHEYIVKSLEYGIDAISEKPMTIDEEKCYAILEAERRSGRKVTVTFNLRFAPYPIAIKQAIMDGVIGKVLSVDLEWMLDTSHGADYFRRWHRRKENSGGLLVHKATHHFDLVNWWIEEEPEEVMAYGTRRFYGPTRLQRGERCLTCDYKNTCEFSYDVCELECDRMLYRECESADGYYRDRCVFSDEIDIEDTMSVNVRYSGGAFLTYSLVAHSPYEGYKASINGTDGRIEIAEYHSGIHANDSCHQFDLYDRKGQRINHTLPKGTGGHGGGDEKLLKMLFTDDYADDPLSCQASSYDGALSIMIGIAANASIAEKRNVIINELVPLDSFKCSDFSVREPLMSVP